jgi:hypothetical protein
LIVPGVDRAAACTSDTLSRARPTIATTSC